MHHFVLFSSRCSQKMYYQSELKHNTQVTHSSCCRGIINISHSQGTVLLQDIHVGLLNVLGVTKTG